MIIDFHLHFFRREGFVEDTLRGMDEAGVAVSVLHAMPPFRFKGHLCGDNEDVLRAVKAHPDRLIGSMYLDPRAPDWETTIERYGGEGFRCVKLFPPVGYSPDEPRCLPMFDRIGRLGLTVLSHAGVTGLGAATNSEYARPMRLDGVLRRFPHVRFVLAHWGGLGTFAEAWALMKANPNLLIDISGTRWSWPGAELFRLHQKVSPVDFARVVWGTDNLDPPAESMKVNRAILREIGKHDFADRVFGETARELLEL